MAAKKKSKQKSAAGAPAREKVRSEEPAAERVKRPELPRTDPIRSWSTLFGPAASGEGPLRSAGGSVQRGVELGYRVIDEYIKQGAAMASTFSNPRAATGGAAGAPGAIPGMPPMADLPQMTERMLRYATDMSSLWFDAMNMMMSNLNAQAASGAAASGAAATSAPGAGVPPNGAPHPGPGTAAPASSAAPRIVLDVRSPEHAAQVIVALETASGEVDVEELRPVSGLEQGGIGGASVRFVPGGTAHVQVRVPKGLEPGRYSGAVLERGSRRPLGRLTVVLGDGE